MTRKQILERVLYGIGGLAFILISHFGPNWSDMSLLMRGAMVLSFAALLAGIGLDVVNRNETVALVNPRTGEREVVKRKRAQKKIDLDWTLVARPLPG
jgi:hypothetical protein